MKLNNLELKELLDEKQVYHLYHANTVRTSRTFLEQGGLMSRGAVEQNDLVQTDQSSDDIDKAFDVWNDIFLDTTDLHKYFGRQNKYGPVLFKISTTFLEELDLDIWVTKDNPINWSKSMTNQNKYFVSVEELREKWDSFQRQRKMITLKNVNEPILFDYVSEVIVDDPVVKLEENGTVLFNEAVKTIKQSLADNPQFINKFKTRVCTNCFCRVNYLNEVNINTLKKLFL